MLPLLVVADFSAACIICCFQVPDEEYCVNLPGLLRCLWQEQQKQPRCLFCCRGFKGIRAALQHMQQQRHFQLKWDEEQQDMLHRFYDYKRSYYEVRVVLEGSCCVKCAGMRLSSFSSNV